MPIAIEREKGPVSRISLKKKILNFPHRSGEATGRKGRRAIFLVSFRGVMLRVFVWDGGDFILFSSGQWGGFSGGKKTIVE